MKHEYHIESFAIGKWLTILKGSLQYCQGFLDAIKDYAPRNAYRLMRSDGRVMEEVAAREDVNIGQIAGWPTAEQYEAAANKALERANAIRERARRTRIARSAGTWSDEFCGEHNRGENEMSAEMEMPRYRSHKEVWALKIKSVERDIDKANAENRETDGSATLTFEEEGYAPITVDHAYVRKHNPQPDGYYVVYADGYKSWSPAEAFEDGYTRVN